MEHRGKGDFLKRLLVAIPALAAALWLGSLLLKSDERIIRERLEKLAATLSVRPGAPALARLASADRAMDFFTRDVSVQVEGTGVHAQDRGDLREAILTARGAAGVMEVSFADVHLKFPESKSEAIGYVTAVARLENQPEPFARELKITFRKEGRAWLISKVESLTLGP